MAMPRLPLLKPHPGRQRQTAALLLTLAVLVGHLAALERPAPPAPRPTPQATLQLRVLLPPAPLAAAAAPGARPAADVPTPARAMPPRSRPPANPNTATARMRTRPAEPTTPEAAPDEPVRPWPVYAAALPPPATRHYQLQRGERRSPARLVWAHDAQGYTLSLSAEGGDLDGLGAASRGHVGPAGLVPERHVERRRGRDQRATNFDLASQTVRGSGGGEAYAWPVGGQDRLSWLLQLAAVLEADASLAHPGARLVLPGAGPRGPAVAWVFTVVGPQSLALADGRTASGLALQRVPQHPYDLQVDVWLDPADHHLPLRLRLAAPPGEWESIWLSNPPP
jgi:hypothetical protein